MARIEDLFVQLTAKSPAEGYAAMKELQAVSETSDAVYPYMARLIGMLGSDNSYARTRGLLLIAANARWDTDCLIDENLNQILSHITDPKPITARQFIQSLPALASAKPDLRAEYAWVPIDAQGYLQINCFWVSGSFKGHGYANELLIQCIADGKAAGKHGLCVISSPKKQSFLSDPKYLAHKGFRVADTAQPYFTLLYLPFADGAPVPKSRECARIQHTDKKGFALYYTAGCPYTVKYVPIMEKAAQDAGIPFQSILIDSREAAQSAPAAWTNFALFYNGAYLTNEILSEKKFVTLAEALKLKAERG